MKTIQELQLLAASKLPEKIVELSDQFFWRNSERRKTNSFPIQDTEWPYIVQELLEKMMDRTTQLKYLAQLAKDFDADDVWPEVLTVDKGWLFRTASVLRCLTAMDEIGFFEKGKKGK